MGSKKRYILPALALGALLGCEDPDPGTLSGDPPSQGPLPDISFASLWVNPRQPIEGQSFTVGMTIRNSGAGPVPAGITHVARWFPDPSSASAACEWPIGRLGSLQQVDVSCTYAGSYTNLQSVAVLDATAAVAESNEGNNSLNLPITVVVR